MTVTRRLRYEILRRDDHACRYCGARAPAVALTVDHVLPVALGGSDEATNLVASCQPCNAGKSSTSPDQPLVDQVGDDALRWARAMRQAAAIQDDDRYLAQSYRQQFSQRWARWTCADGDIIPLPDDWADSIQQFYRAGLEIEIVMDMVDVAGRSRASAAGTFRYFCGCCWKVLRERQEIAHGLLKEVLA